VRQKRGGGSQKKTRQKMTGFSKELFFFISLNPLTFLLGKNLNPFPTMPYKGNALEKNTNPYRI
jgi:hypothetical protein